MPRTREVAINTLFAEVLRGKHPLWNDRLYVEQTGVLRDAPRARPDVLVHVVDSQPVAVETEYDPASTVEDDAKARLGKTPSMSADPIEQAIAVRIPESLRQDQADLAERIAVAEFGYCVYSGDPADPNRWPEAGWLAGGIDQIARCIEHAMVSQRLIDESMAILEEGVQIATQAVKDAGERGFPDVERDLGRVLNQRDGEQTTRMAMTIIANALTSHAAISGTHAISSVAQLKAESQTSFQLGLLDAWRHILDEVNYWPIFKGRIRSSRPLARCDSSARPCRARSSSRTPRPHRSDYAP